MGMIPSKLHYTLNKYLRSSVLSNGSVVFFALIVLVEKRVQIRGEGGVG